MPNYKRKNISITPEQAKYVKENDISLSKFVQSALDKQIEIESRRDMGQKKIQRTITTFYFLTFTGLATLLSGLLLPVFAGASALPSILLTIIGGAVLIFGLSEVRWWTRFSARD